MSDAGTTPGPQAEATVSRPLAGHVVVDFGGWRGALTGRMLADLGADVIAVEERGGGEIRRHPPFLDFAADPDFSSGYWLAHGAGKRSLALDLLASGADDIVKLLVDRASFIIESLPHDLADAIGLTYERVRERNARAVMVSVTAFGRQARDGLLQRADGGVAAAASGFLLTTGDPDRPPVMIRGEQAFLHACAYATAGALLAHRARGRSGEGMHVDVSAQEALSLALGLITPTWQIEGKRVTRFGSAFPGREHPKARYEVLDGFIIGDMKAGGPDRIVDWMKELGEPDTEALHEEVERMDIATDPLERLLAVEKRFADFFARRTKREVWDAAIAREIQLFPVNSLAENVFSPVHADRGFFAERQAEALPPFQYPVRILPESPTPGQLHLPRPGQDTFAILRELGMDAATIEAYWRAGVI